MKQVLVMIAAVVLVGCGKKVATNSPAVVTNSSAVVAEVQLRIRHAAGKPVGELIEADYEKVTELNLKRMGLTEFPKELKKLTKLKWLSLYENQLTDVKGLEKLKQLEYLDLNHNQLTEVPKELEMLQNLNDLFLGWNKLTNVNGVEKLTTIRRLSLAGNQLTNVKGLERLMQLRLLSMRDNSDLTEDQKSKLQKALPHCSILFHL